MTDLDIPMDQFAFGVAAHRSFIAVAVSAALLIGCSSSEGGNRETTPGSAPNDVVDSVVTTEAPPVTVLTTSQTTDDPTPTSTTPQPATTSTTSAPPAAPPATVAPTGPACLIGDWLISDRTLSGYFDAVEANSGFDSIDGSGVIRLTFGDTTYDWANDYRLTMVIDGATYEAVQSGGFSGTYIESDGVLIGTTDQDGRTGTITRDGSPLTEDVGDLFVDINPAHPMDMLSYSCDGPTVLLGAGPRADALYSLALDPA